MSAPKPEAVVIIPREAFGPSCTHGHIEVGETAVWTVSSAKHGNGVGLLRDGDPSTFWQSDDVLPHTISIQFPELTCVSLVAIHLNAASDESYTPKKLSVYSGTHPCNAVEVASANVENPDGWMLLRVSDGLAAMASMASMAAAQANTNSHAKDTQGTSDNALSASTVTGGAEEVSVGGESNVWCTFINILIVQNHQDGRDTHVRGVRVFGPGAAKKYTSSLFESYDALR